MEKRKPHYPLAAVKAAFADPAALNRSFVSKQGADALETDDVAVVATIQALVTADFEKSMTSHANHRVWAQSRWHRTLHKVHARRPASFVSDQLHGGMSMAKTPRDYPATLASSESGRPMMRGDKLVTLKVNGKAFEYRQPGWWCSLDDPDDLDGQLVDEDNLVAEMARRTAQAIARGEAFPPVLIRAIRLRCGLSQRDAGDLFGTGEKSFEKYEAGQIPPSKPTQRLLRLAMERPDLFTKPARGALKPPAAADVSLIQATIKEARLDRIYAPLFRDRSADAAA